MLAKAPGFIAKGLAKVREELEKAGSDIVFMFGDDQKAAYQNDNFPAMLIYRGAEYRGTPLSPIRWTRAWRTISSSI